MNNTKINKPIRVFEGFAGYGGASFGLQRAGIPHEVVGYSEFDKFAAALYDANHRDKNGNPMKLKVAKNVLLEFFSAKKLDYNNYMNSEQMEMLLSKYFNGE
jgi:site-specific DNA-cytosine methylase